MATRSNIGILQSNGTINSIYCHWDGYPSHNGKILLEHYKDNAKIITLIQGGSISSLDENIEGGIGHTFENKLDGQTVFYKRDRGETDVDFINVPLSEFHQEEYSYYWDGENWNWSADGENYKILTEKDTEE